MNPSTSLHALSIIAHYHGVSVDAADITHRFIEEGELDLNLNTWLLAAKYLELKAKVVKKDIERLDMVSLPAVVWREDGEHFILAKVDGDRFLIQDLTLNKPLVLEKEEFAKKYSGTLICVSSRASILGQLAKFDFTWFIPSLIKYRKIIGEVMLISVVIQIFALITPLFFQVVMDKVLVHRSFSTLDVIAIAFVTVTVFDVVLGGLRTYIFSHTTSRIDVRARCQVI